MSPADVLVKSESFHEALENLYCRGGGSKTSAATTVNNNIGYIVMHLTSGLNTI